jgi:hypothetical protein
LAQALGRVLEPELALARALAQACKLAEPHVGQALEQELRRVPALAPELRGVPALAPELRRVPALAPELRGELEQWVALEQC